MRYILALDAGTGSVRAVVFNEKGEQIAESQREYSHKEDKRYPGSIDFDVQNNWKLICSCIKDVVEKVGKNNIVVVSSTSMREAFVLYDQNKNEIWACSNVDARAYNETVSLRKNKNIENDIYKISGQTFSLCAIPRLLWLKNNDKEVYEKSCYMNMLSDWISVKLGADICIEPSNGSTLGLFNLKTRAFDKDIFKIVSIDDKFASAKICEPGSIIGEVSNKASKDTGLKEKTLIVMGGGDAQLGTLGVGAVKNKDAVILGGTFWQQEVNVATSLTDSRARIRVNCHSLKNLWQAEGIVFYPGLVARWFRDAFCPDLKEIAEKNNTSEYKILSEKAKEVPAGSYGIIPIFSDKMNYISWKHASPSFINMSIDPSKTNRYSIFRAIMENAALVSSENLNIIKDFTKVDIEKVIFAGGASKDPVWCQILADVLQVEVHTTKVKEATALGSAMCAAIGGGLFSDFYEVAESWVKKSVIYIPDRKNKNTYEDLMYKFREIYKIQLKLSDNNLTTHMWKAPGE